MMKRIIAVAALLVLLTAAWPSNAAPNTDRIRVLITRFGTLYEAEIQFSGSYSCENLYFQREMKITVTAEGKKGLLLRYGGLVLSSNGPLTLLRHQTQGENGLRLQGTLNLYTGDLTITNQNGVLQLVLSVPLEEYLLGVLPYEMSSGFPLEALKAQAVAARTYALTRRNPDRDYDVVDNTNDQVYAGILEDAAIIRKAISGTEGICVYYQGSLVTCYYTASNGGRVESIADAWGMLGKQYEYVRSKADPYDLENDESVVKQAVIPVHPENEASEALEPLLSLLRTAAAGPLKKLGYSDAPEDISIQSIDEIVAVGDVPDTLSFTLHLAGRRIADPDEHEVSFYSGKAEEQPAETPAPGAMASLSNPVQVTLPIFPELEKALQISINTSANELWSVKAEKDRFVIEARRFGHGVGLSQRGAQRMAAAYHWTYQQILHFYYSNVTLRKVKLAAATPAPKLTYDFDATPGPKPTATPRPTLMPLVLKPDQGEKLATVDQIEQDSTLNLRSAPDTSSEIVMRLYYGQQLAILEHLPGGWVHVRTDSAEGYVMEKFISIQE